MTKHEQPTAIAEVLLHLKDTVAEGVRLAQLPRYIGTARAAKETGLSPRQLKHLRETARISWRKPNGSILYDTTELFREIDRSKVPTITP